MNVDSVGIIGRGDFGSLMEAMCQKHFPDIEVRITSSRFENDGVTFFPIEETAAADVVIPAVPIRAFADVIHEVASHTSKDTIIWEVCTVKEHPITVLQEEVGSLDYIATHPMFGPNSFRDNDNSLSGLQIVLADDNLSEKKRQQMMRVFDALDLQMTEMSAAEHDRQLAESLFVTHIIGQVIHNAEIEMQDIVTTSFSNLMQAVEMVRDDRELFEDVYAYNSHCEDVLENLTESLDAITHSLKE